jgi:hypothetical protein
LLNVRCSALIAFLFATAISGMATPVARAQDTTGESADDWHKANLWRVSIGLNFTTIDDPDFSRTVGAGFGVGYIRRFHHRVRLDLGVSGTYPVAAIEDWANGDFGLPAGDWQIESFQLDIAPRIIVDLDDPHDAHFYLIAGPEFQQVLWATYLDNMGLEENISADTVEDSVVAFSYGMGIAIPSISGREFRFEVRRSRTLDARLSNHNGRMDGVAIEMSACF